MAHLYRQEGIQEGNFGFKGWRQKGWLIWGRWGVHHQQGVELYPTWTMCKPGKKWLQKTLLEDYEDGMWDVEMVNLFCACCSLIWGATSRRVVYNI